MDRWEKNNKHKRGEYNTEYFRRFLLSRTFNKYFKWLKKEIEG